MSTITQQQKVLKGGEWLVKESTPFETFIPEEYNEEQQMEIYPNPGNSKVVYINIKERVNNIMIMNAAGIMVYKNEQSIEPGTHRLQVELPAGVYTIQIAFPEGIVTKKYVRL